MLEDVSMNWGNKIPIKLGRKRLGNKSTEIWSINRICVFIG